MEFSEFDIELVKRAREGSQEAFEELIRRHSRYMFGIAYGLLNTTEDAEEIVQDAFLKAYRNLQSLRDDKLFFSWLCRITLNMSRNRYNWNKIRGKGQNVSINEGVSADNENKGEMELLSDLAQPDKELEKKEIEKFILQAMESLPEIFREPLVLRHIKDLSYKEIADILNLNIDTVKTRISRGRAILASKIKNKI
ncbi:MAG TPA: sigma-70 family RNA polymerase sigma factor [Victivallales bacterium]|nr:sigma-70 family RNA polymerase sigma factor [Victivallales bacterium]HPO90503.1 sigma-70 family RNA polymerase sigma factor [Victivallales bacterium]HRU01165.1 sigma-70 family RNA polymerase sigma factor [Victivallales bacterium]